MGQTTERVTIRNFLDVGKTAEGLMTEDDIREVEVDAIVDTGASLLCLPPSVIEELGLMYSRSVSVKTANGEVERRIFLGGYITVKERSVQMEVMENDATTPALIGCLVLEAMDFVVDPTSERIIGNPAHDGKWYAYMY